MQGFKGPFSAVSIRVKKEMCLFCPASLHWHEPHHMEASRRTAFQAVSLMPSRY